MPGFGARKNFGRISGKNIFFRIETKNRPDIFMFFYDRPSAVSSYLKNKNTGHAAGKMAFGLFFFQGCRSV